MEQFGNRFFTFGFVLLVGLTAVNTVFPTLGNPANLAKAVAPIVETKPAELKKAKPAVAKADRKENHDYRQTSKTITVDVSTNSYSTEPTRPPPNRP